MKSISEYEIIRSRRNSTIVEIAKLQQKKYRNQEKLFLSYGIKLLRECYSFNVKIRYILLEEGNIFDEEVLRILCSCEENGVKILLLSCDVFEKVSEEQSPDGVICVCEFLNNIRYFTNAEIDLSASSKTIILDSIRDPGNIGTIIRTAAAFGMKNIIISRDCADVYSSKVLRSSMGALFKLNIYICDSLIDVILIIKKERRRVISTSLRINSMQLGKDLIFPSDVFILGNEGHGLSDDILGISDETLFIPIKDSTESLNVATAGTILMWELNKTN